MGSDRWQETPAGLKAQWHFADYAAVCTAVQSLMALAVRLDHHPLVSFDFRSVTVTWWTHDAQAITPRDHQAAAETDSLMAPKALR